MYVYILKVFHVLIYLIFDLKERKRLGISGSRVRSSLMVIINQRTPRKIPIENVNI